MNRQAWRDFFITVFFLGISLVIAILSSIVAEENQIRLAAVAAAISLLMAFLGAIYIIPRLARNVRLEFLRFGVKTSVTVEGVLFAVFLLVVGFAAWNTGNNLLYLILSALVAFLAAANLIARLSLVDVSVQLRFPDHIFAGEAAKLAVTVVNHKRLIPSYSLMVEAMSDDEGLARVAEDLPPDDVADGDGAPPRKTAPQRVEMTSSKLAYFVVAPPRANARQRFDYTFPRRGRYPVTSFRISTKFPAGFFKKWRRVEASGEILVYPKPRPLDDFYHALPMLAGQMQSLARGSGSDLYAIRRYQPFDHIRHIDWKATAKAQEMMVREHAREDEWRLTIVLDTSRPMRPYGVPEEAAGAADEADEESPRKTPDTIFEEKFERAIELAASLANHFILERADVELLTPHRSHNIASGSGHDHLYKILRSLATIEPAPPAESPPASSPRRRWFGRKAKDDASRPAPPAPETGWRLPEQIPVLGDERRFKVLITAAAKGTIPASVWRSSHVVFIEDL